MTSERISKITAVVERIREKQPYLWLLAQFVGFSALTYAHARFFTDISSLDESDFALTFLGSSIYVAGEASVFWYLKINAENMLENLQHSRPQKLEQESVSSMGTFFVPTHEGLAPPLSGEKISFTFPTKEDNDHADLPQFGLDFWWEETSPNVLTYRFYTSNSSLSLVWGYQHDKDNRRVFKTGLNPKKENPRSLIDHPHLKLYFSDDNQLLCLEIQGRGPQVLAQFVPNEVVASIPELTAEEETVASPSFLT